MCVDLKGNIYLILPGNCDASLTVLRGRKDEGCKNFETVWRGDGYDGEPQVDVQLLEKSDTVSIFTRTSGVGKKVVVLDLAL
jgi:hypothetical protein